MDQTVADIVARLRKANKEEFAVLERSLRADTRKGVKNALATAKKRLELEEAEEKRIELLYGYESVLAEGKIVVGLDEVGRGPLAGPLTVAAVVLDTSAPKLLGLNDSKQVSPAKREELSLLIKETALAWTIVHIDPKEIDSLGMSACLRVAFSTAVKNIEEKGIIPELILLDGNPLHFDSREHNIVKGDSKCASIAAASIIAKVARDALMDEYDLQYPGYDFAQSKGYGSARHCQAIKEKGVSPIHRVSFCHNFMQETLF